MLFSQQIYGIDACHRPTGQSLTSVGQFLLRLDCSAIKRGPCPALLAGTGITLY
jgi:hypothetical protein